MTNKTEYSSEFKGKVALAAIDGRKTIAELCKEYNLPESLIYEWRTILLQNGSMLFVKNKNKSFKNRDVLQLQAKLKRLSIERDFLKKVLNLNE